MEKGKYGKYVELTDKEYNELEKRFGTALLKEKIKSLNELREKQTEEERMKKSDYLSLIRINNVQNVQPIRMLDKIEEMKEVLRKQSERNYLLFLMGINVGIRIGDLVKLRVKDVKREYVVLSEQKTRKAKRFKLNRSLQEYLKIYTSNMSPDDYLFPSRKGNGRPITRVQAYRILKAAGNEVGLENIGTHSLRKTFGRFFYQKTKDIAMLQEIFNHSEIKITRRYIGVSQDDIDKAMDDFSL